MNKRHKIMIKKNWISSNEIPRNLNFDVQEISNKFNKHNHISKELTTLLVSFHATVALINCVFTVNKS